MRFLPVLQGAILHRSFATIARPNLQLTAVNRFFERLHRSSLLLHVAVGLPSPIRDFKYGLLLFKFLVVHT